MPLKYIMVVCVCFSKEYMLKWICMCHGKLGGGKFCCIQSIRTHPICLQLKVSSISTGPAPCHPQLLPQPHADSPFSKGSALLSPGLVLLMCFCEWLDWTMLVIHAQTCGTLHGHVELPLSHSKQLASIPAILTVLVNTYVNTTYISLHVF